MKASECKAKEPSAEKIPTKADAPADDSPAKPAPKRRYEPYVLPDPDSYPHVPREMNLFRQGEKELAFTEFIDGMLRRMHKRHDPEPIMQQVRATFPSPLTMLMADRMLWESFGLRRNDALLMSKLLDFYRFMNFKSFGEHPRIARLMDISPYALSIFLGRREECIYMVCMNKRGNLKKLVKLHEGTEDGALLSINKLLCEVVRYKPVAIVICHNHPGGTLRPSNEDVSVTIQILEALRIMRVPLLDHLVVTNTTVVSLRDNGFLPERYWMSQQPDHYFLRNWLKPYPPGKKPKTSP